MGLLEGAITAVAVAFVAEAIQTYINYHKDLVEQVNKAVQAYKEEKDAISQTTSRIKELYDKINSGQLSYDEHVEANRDLLDIQKEMIDNYGSQVQGIDLVTQSIEKQTDALNRYQEAASRAAYYNMQNTINQDSEEQKDIQAMFSAAVGSYFGFLGAPGIASYVYDQYKKSGSINPRNWNQGLVQNIEGSNADQLKEFLEQEYVITLTSDAKANEVIANLENVERTGEGFKIFGNANEVRTTIDYIRAQYPKLIDDNEALRLSLQKADQEAQQAQSDWSAYYEVEMDYRSKAYQELIDTANKAYDEYVKAITPDINGLTDPEAIHNAEATYRNAIRDINNSVEDLDVRDYILNQFQSLDVASYKVEDDFKNIKNIIDNYSEDIAEDINDNPISFDVEAKLDLSTIGNSGSFVEDIIKEYDTVSSRLTSGSNEYTKAIESSWGRLYQKITDGNLTAYDLLTTTDQDLIQLMNELAAKYGVLAPDFIALLEKLQIVQNGNDQLAAKKVTNNFTGGGVRHHQEMERVRKEYTEFIKEQGEDFANWINEELVIPDGVFYSTEELLKLYDEWINKAEEVQKVTRFAYDAVDSLAETESAINSLADLYWEVVEKDPNADEDSLANWGIADPAKINAVEQAFSKLVETQDEVTQEKLSLALKDFEETLVHFPGDSEKAEEAINKLITTFINESDILNDLTEENQEYIKARLESIGVTNAEEVVQSRLTGTVKVTTTAIKELRDAYNQYYETIKGGDTASEEYSKAMNSLSGNVADAIAFRDSDGGIVKAFEISPEFVRNHLDTVEKMLDGDEEALRDLQKAAMNMEFRITMGATLPEEAVDSFFNDLWDLIDWTNFQTIEIGADLNDQAFIDGLNKIVGDSYEAALKMQEYFAPFMNISLANNYSKNGGGGMSSDVARIMTAQNSKNGWILGASKTGDSGLGDRAKYGPKPPSDKGGAGDAGKDAADEYLEAFNAELENLDWLHSNGKVIAVRYSNVA